MLDWKPIETAPPDTLVRVRPARDEMAGPYEFAARRPKRDPRWRAATDNKPLSPVEWAPADL